MDLPVRDLNDSTTIPALGLGTYPLRGEAGVTAIGSAISVGYRLVDSAVNYDNEGALGEAVRRSDVPRDQLVLSSKLPGRHQRRAAALDTVAESCWRAGIDAWDLYLVHWPNPARGRYVEAWQGLVDARERGLVRTIGVSNFLPEHLRAVIEATGVVPAVNQVELHPYFPQAQARAVHDELGIVTQAWSPLGRGRRPEAGEARARFAGSPSAAGGWLLDEPVLAQVAAEVGRTPAQVVLRWHLQLGVVPLPKAADPARQVANLDVVDWSLTDEQMAAVTGLGRADGRLWGGDPATHEEM